MEFPDANVLEGVVAPRAGKKVKTARWTLATAAFEFGIDRAALAKRLRALGIEPGADGCYSTLQVCSARFGNLEMERTRKAREDADAAERENKIANRELCYLHNVIKLVEDVAIGIRQLILASKVSKQDQDDLLAELKALFDNNTITKNLFPRS